MRWFGVATRAETMPLWEVGHRWGLLFRARLLSANSPDFCEVLLRSNAKESMSCMSVAIRLHALNVWHQETRTRSAV